MQNYGQPANTRIVSQVRVPFINRGPYSTSKTDNVTLSHMLFLTVMFSALQAQRSSPHRLYWLAFYLSFCRWAQSSSSSAAGKHYYYCLVTSRSTLSLSLSFSTYFKTPYRFSESMLLHFRGKQNFWEGTKDLIAFRLKEQLISSLPYNHVAAPQEGSVSPPEVSGQDSPPNSLVNRSAAEIFLLPTMYSGYTDVWSRKLPQTIICVCL